MIFQNYSNQVRLLLTVLPEIAKENCFALHGGTAINLFVRNMPRLSVDIDLTYLPLDSRTLALANINAALKRVKIGLEKVHSNAQITHLVKEGKIIITNNRSTVKIEVNQIKRGCYSPPVKMILCQKAQEEYEAFCITPVVEKGLLYGGKVCAALDRQHPRDLFDVKYMLENESFDSEIKKGFIFYLVSGDRPINEILAPNFIDAKERYKNQFDGMTNEKFDYSDYDLTRQKLIECVRRSLNEEDKKFILSIKRLEPEWTIYNFKDYPAIQWKLKNLQQLKDQHPKKHLKLYNLLEKKLVG